MGQSPKTAKQVHNIPNVRFVCHLTGNGNVNKMGFKCSSQNSTLRTYKFISSRKKLTMTDNLKNNLRKMQQPNRDTDTVGLPKTSGTPTELSGHLLSLTHPTLPFPILGGHSTN